MELIEDPTVECVESDMRTTLQRQFDSQPVKIDHNLYKPNQPWPLQTKVWCSHCAHPFTNMPLPLVARYDHDRRQAVCFGNFCSANCGRAYALDHRPLSWAQAMLWYTKVLSECFGIPAETSGRPAWPKERLRAFGGDLSIEEFRAGFSTPLVLRVENVTFCMQNLSLVEVSCAQASGISVGKQEISQGTSETDHSEQTRLQALARQVISKKRSAPASTGSNQIAHIANFDAYEGDTKETTAETTRFGGKADACAIDFVDMQDYAAMQAKGKDDPQLSSPSILATFLENLRMYKGNEQEARKAMMDVGGSGERSTVLHALKPSPMEPKVNPNGAVC